MIPTPDASRPIEQQDEDVLLGMLVYGEARGESVTGRTAVAHVALNRVLDMKRRYGSGLRAVILKPWQFSCFNENDPNREKLLGPFNSSGKATWDGCYAAALAARCVVTDDPTGGANLYHVAGIELPKWATAPGVKHKVQIGRHLFYKEP